MKAFRRKIGDFADIELMGGLDDSEVTHRAVLCRVMAAIGNAPDITGVGRRGDRAKCTGKAAAAEVLNFAVPGAVYSRPGIPGRIFRTATVSAVQR